MRVTNKCDEFQKNKDNFIQWQQNKICKNINFENISQSGIKKQDLY